MAVVKAKGRVAPPEEAAVQAKVKAVAPEEAVDTAVAINPAPVLVAAASAPSVARKSPMLPGSAASTRYGPTVG